MIEARASLSGSGFSLGVVDQWFRVGDRVVRTPGLGSSSGL